MTILPFSKFTGFGPLGDTDDAILKLQSTISLIIGIFTVSAGLWFIVQIFTNAFKWLVSDGEKQAIEAARKGLTHSVIGLFIIVSAYALIAIVGSVLGLPILDFATTIKNNLDPTKQ